MPFFIQTPKLNTWKFWYYCLQPPGAPTPRRDGANRRSESAHSDGRARRRSQARATEARRCKRRGGNPPAERAKRRALRSKVSDEANRRGSERSDEPIRKSGDGFRPIAEATRQGGRAGRRRNNRASRDRAASAHEE